MDFLFCSELLSRPFQAREKIESMSRRRNVMSNQTTIRPP